jgi:hypothetical protein
MKGAYCPREPDVLRAVARAWREGADAGVAAHAASCARCTEVRRAAELLRASFIREAEAARVPSAAAMWWRLERRYRYEQARRMQRIALAVQALVLACAAGVAVAIVQIAAPWLHSGSAVLRRWDGLDAALAALSNGVVSWTLPVAMLVAAWLVLVPAAVYLGLADD